MIENDEQLRLLRLLGCDMVQGFLFSRPVPAAEIDAMLIGERGGLRAGGGAVHQRRAANSA